MTPAELRAIRGRVVTWDLACVVADRANLLAEVERLTTALINRTPQDVRTAQADAYDEGWERGYFDRAADAYHGKEGGTTNPYRRTP